MSSILSPEDQERARARQILQVALAARWTEGDVMASSDERLQRWMDRYADALDGLLHDQKVKAVALLRDGFPSEGLNKVQRLLDASMND